MCNGEVRMLDLSSREYLKSSDGWCYDELFISEYCMKLSVNNNDETFLKYTEGKNRSFSRQLREH